MATAANIILTAFQKIGVYSPTVAQQTSALASLNNMISSWGAELRNHKLSREYKALTAGTAEYTVGSGGDWDTTRPVKLESAYLRDSNNYDWPLEIINAKQYNSHYCKSLEGRPERIYFVPEYPLAKIIFDYEPDTTYTVYCDFIRSLSEFTATTDTVSLPNEYKEALVYNLSVSLGEDWEKQVSKSVQDRAKETKLVIDRLDAANRPPTKARFDMMMGSNYNIETDQ
jgi:hypothetical protein